MWSAKWYAARDAARKVYNAGIADAPEFAKLRDEAAKSQESLVQLIRDMCAVGRVPAEVLS